MAVQLVGEFELGELIATGTVGEVYRARHLESGRQVVIKLLQPEVANEPDVQRRFVREVSIAEKLHHPNIVRHYDCGLFGDRIYFAMELVECGTLKQVLERRRRLPWREAVECAIQICAALEYAHESGVIHRDLKPANLFLSEDGKVKVGDFGLARDLASTRLTLEGTTVGTCRYMPPEQIAGEAQLTGATDLYALGCVLYEMITGRTPFDGRSIVEIFEQHLNETPPPPTQFVRDCPAELSELILALLEKSASDRPASAGAVRGALADILHGRPMHLHPRPTATSEQDTVPAKPPDGPNLTQRLQAAPESTREQTWSWTVVLAVVAALAAILAVIAAFVVWLR